MHLIDTADEWGLVTGFSRNVAKLLIPTRTESDLCTQPGVNAC
jgi:hypothetical protein